MGSSDPIWKKQLDDLLTDAHSSPEKQLASLRAVTAITGVVHEAQMLQLRMWAALAFGYTTWTAEVDVAGKTVIFILTKSKRPTNLVRLVAGLDRSIHWLLGDNWGLLVKEGSKKLYEGQRQNTNVSNERHTRAGNREG